MRIGIMLRAYDRPGGIGIYCRNLVPHLLELDHSNEYLLIHNNPAHLGKYADRANVEEISLDAKSPLVWDQWQVPRLIKRQKLDLIFNTKFSVPLFTRAKRIMVLHGASWYTHPELYGKGDIMYVKAAMPVFCRRADFLISNSELTTRDFMRILEVPEHKIQTVLLAAGDGFAPVVAPTILDRARENYHLPQRFILTVTSYDPRKNFATLLKAFSRVRREERVDLVVVGKGCSQWARDYDLTADGLAGHIRFLGWVEQEDLPAIYSLASAFAFPSVYEEFGIPVVEAMACGLPLAAASTGALPELTQGAGLHAEPFDHEALADNLLTILTDPEKAADMRASGLNRAKDFSWPRHAQATLAIMGRILSGEGGS